MLEINPDVLYAKTNSSRKAKPPPDAPDGGANTAAAPPPNIIQHHGCGQQLSMRALVNDPSLIQHHAGGLDSPNQTQNLSSAARDEKRLRLRKA